MRPPQAHRAGHVVRAPAALLKLRPDVPRDLERIVHKAIDRDPGRRYQTAAEAAWRWARRHPGTAVLTALILFLMVGVTVGSLVAASYFDRLASKAEETAELERDAREQAAKQQAVAEDARHEAEERKVEADRQRKDTERLVARQFVDAGTRLAADGDVAGALLWNVAAIAADPEQADSVRTLFAMMLRQAPVPVQTLFHNSAINSFTIDPRGRTVAAVCEKGEVVIHDLETGRRLHTLEHDGTVFSVAYSRDGSRLVTLYRAGEWKQAIADFTDIPGDPITRSYLMLRGNSYAELGRWEEARRDFRAYEEWLINPDNQPKAAFGSAQRLSGASQRALVELPLGNRAEFKRMMAEQALGRGIKVMADPTKERPPMEDSRAFGSGPGPLTPLTWQKRIVNETLRREAEEVVRGKKP